MRVDLPCSSLAESKDVNAGEEWWPKIPENQLQSESRFLGYKEGSSHQGEHWDSTYGRINTLMHKTWLANAATNLITVKQFLLDYASYDRAKIASHSEDGFAEGLSSGSKDDLGCVHSALACNLDI